MGAATECGNLCNPVSIQGAGWAFASFGAGDSINWSFSFSASQNGIQLTDPALAEIFGLQSSTGAPMNSGVPGFNYNIGRWVGGAVHRLKHDSCSSFFGGKGASTIKATNYLPLAASDLPNSGFTNVFAETYPGSYVVWVNALSRIFQALPGEIFDEALTPGGVSAEDAGAYGILHELSHQLQSTTGSAFDLGESPASIGFNLWNTVRVMQACP